MPESAQLLTRSELKALSWAVRRASNNGGGFAREVAAAQKVLEKLGRSMLHDDSARPLPDVPAQQRSTNVHELRPHRDAAAPVEAGLRQSA